MSRLRIATTDLAYDKQAYLNYKQKLIEDPIRYEEAKRKWRERQKSRLQNPINQQLNRLRTKKYRENEKKINPNFQIEENIRSQKFRLNQRNIIINHYSNGKNNCNCCGEKTFLFLEIDHINGSGRKHLKQIGMHIHSWLIQNNFPKGFQVLCSNCNKGKYLNKGVCPHVT